MSETTGLAVLAGILVAAAALWWINILRRRLRESEARYHTLIDRAPEAIIVLDAVSRRFTEVNRNAVRLFGYPAERLLTMGPKDLSPPFQPDGRASAVAAEEYVNAALAEGEAMFEWTHRTADGDYIPCEMRLNRLPGTHCLRGSIIDISERKAAEDTLRHSEARYHAIFASAAVPLWELRVDALRERLEGLRSQGVTDIAAYLREGPGLLGEVPGLLRVVGMNEAALEVFAAGSREELGANLRRLFVPESRPGLTAFITALAAGRDGFETEITLRSLDGHMRELLMRVAVPERTTLSTIVVSLVDITTRKRLERELVRRRRELQAVFDAIPDATVYVDNRRRVLMANPAVERIFGYRPHEILGHDTAEFYAERGDYEDRGDWRGFNDSDHIEPYIVRYRRADGSLFDGETLGARVRDETGQVAGFVGVIRDVTARRAAEEQRLRE